MSSRPFSGPFKAIDAGDMSAVSITSKASLVPTLSLMSYTYSWVGTAPIGVLTVQVSNDYSQFPDGSVRNAGTWTTVSFTNAAGSIVTSAPVSGGTGNGAIGLNNFGFYAIRTVYTKTSGVGAIDAVFTAKVA